MKIGETNKMEYMWWKHRNSSFHVVYMQCTRKRTHTLTHILIQNL